MFGRAASSSNRLFELSPLTSGVLTVPWWRVC